MHDKKFYDRIIEDEQFFDKVIYDIEHFIENAPTVKARQLGYAVKQGLVEIKKIASYYSDAKK